MTETATKKFNFPERTAYLEMPRAFYGKSTGEAESPFKGLNSRARSFLAVVHTANKIAGEPVQLTYDDFISVFGGSKETVSKYKQLLINKGIIEESWRSTYKIIVPYSPKPFDKIKKCLFNEVVEMHDEESSSRKRRYKTYRKLSHKAIQILTFIENMEKTGEFSSSQVRIAGILGMPRTTAGDGIRESVYARLLTCSTPTSSRKAKSGLTMYEVDEELKAVKYIEPKPTASTKPCEEAKGYLGNVQSRERPQARNQNRGQGEEPSRNLAPIIERHYFDLRHKAEARADAIYNKALADKFYGGIAKQLNNLSIEIAFAELKDPKRAQELEVQRVALEVKGDKRLKELGINKATFKPRYHCNICNDTGYDSGGAQCECLKRFLKTINK